MTVVTDRGNFSSFEDLLKDMQQKNGGYDRVRVLRTEHVCGQIKLGGGIMSIEDVKSVISEIHREP